jgi:hypothetical protein
MKEPANTQSTSTIQSTPLTQSLNLTVKNPTNIQSTSTTQSTPLTQSLNLTVKNPTNIQSTSTTQSTPLTQSLNLIVKESVTNIPRTVVPKQIINLTVKQSTVIPTINITNTNIIQVDDKKKLLQAQSVDNLKFLGLQQEISPMNRDQKNQVMSLKINNMVKKDVDQLPLFNEFYMPTISFDDQISPQGNIIKQLGSPLIQTTEEPKITNGLDNKRIIPGNIVEWAAQNRVTKSIPLHSKQLVKKPTKQAKSEKNIANKQFIEIDRLLSDIDRMLVLIRSCYPLLNNVPDQILRSEIDVFTKHITRYRGL